MRLLLTIKIWPEGKNYVAFCPELEVASQGKNPEHALKRIREAIEAFLEEARKMGTLEEILRAVGFVKENKRWKPPIISISPLEVKV